MVNKRRSKKAFRKVMAGQHVTSLESVAARQYLIRRYHPVWVLAVDIWGEAKKAAYRVNDTFAKLWESMRLEVRDE